MKHWIEFDMRLSCFLPNIAIYKAQLYLTQGLLKIWTEHSHWFLLTQKLIWGIMTKISAFLQLKKKWILTKFEGCGSKNRPATPIGSFRCFWQEIQIQATWSLQIWHKVCTYWGEKLVKIWFWYLKPLSQKWFETSKPNFHKLFTSIGTHFVPNLKALGGLDLDFLPKASKISDGHSHLFSDPHLQIWREIISHLVVRLLKILLGYLKYLKN